MGIIRSYFAPHLIIKQTLCWIAFSANFLADNEVWYLHQLRAWGERALCWVDEAKETHFPANEGRVPGNREFQIPPSWSDWLQWARPKTGQRWLLPYKHTCCQWLAVYYSPSLTPAAVGIIKFVAVVAACIVTFFLGMLFALFIFDFISVYDNGSSLYRIKLYQSYLHIMTYISSKKGVEVLIFFF